MDLFGTKEAVEDATLKLDQVKGLDYVSPLTNPEKTKTTLIPDALAVTKALQSFLGYRGSSIRGTYSPTPIALALLEGSGQSYDLVDTCISHEDMERLHGSTQLFHDRALDKDEIALSLKIKHPNGYKSAKLAHNAEDMAAVAGSYVLIANGLIINNSAFEPLKTTAAVKIASMNYPVMQDAEHLGVDHSTYFARSDRLDHALYGEDIIYRYELLFLAMQSAGINMPILPAPDEPMINGGTKYAKEVAFLHAKAIRALLESTKFSEFKSIIISHASGKQGPIYKAYQEAFAGYKHNPAVLLTDKEMTGMAIHLAKDKKLRIGYTVFTHPTRRVGGHWAIGDEGDASGQGGEENAVRHTVSFLLTHDPYLNANAFDEAFYYPVMLTHAPQLYKPLVLSKQDRRYLGMRMAILTEALKEKIYINYNEYGTPYITFKHKRTAYQLVKALHHYGIGNEQTGKPKSVQQLNIQGKSYPVVYFTPKQMLTMRDKADSFRRQVVEVKEKEKSERLELVLCKQLKAEMELPFIFFLYHEKEQEKPQSYFTFKTKDHAATFAQGLKKQYGLPLKKPQDDTTPNGQAISVIMLSAEEFTKLCEALSSEDRPQPKKPAAKKKPASKKPDDKKPKSKKTADKKVEEAKKPTKKPAAKAKPTKAKQESFPIDPATVHFFGAPSVMEKRKKKKLKTKVKK